MTFLILMKTFITYHSCFVGPYSYWSHIHIILNHFSCQPISFLKIVNYRGNENLVSLDIMERSDNFPLCHVTCYDTFSEPLQLSLMALHAVGFRKEGANWRWICNIYLFVVIITFPPLHNLLILFQTLYLICILSIIWTRVRLIIQQIKLNNAT